MTRIDITLHIPQEQLNNRPHLANLQALVGNIHTMVAVTAISRLRDLLESLEVEDRAFEVVDRALQPVDNVMSIVLESDHRAMTRMLALHICIHYHAYRERSQGMLVGKPAVENVKAANPMPPVKRRLKLDRP